MASDTKTLTSRIMARFRRFTGITSSVEISDSRKTIEESVHYGMFTEDELRHIDQSIVHKGVTLPGSKKELTEQNISGFLTEVASNTRKKIDEIRNLKILAPEIDQAKAIIVSSILSPNDLQTDAVSVSVNHPGLDDTVNTAITEYLTNYFNNEFHLGPKLVDWLGCAGFEEGAKALLVLPKNEIDVLNTVADRWDPETVKRFRELRHNVEASEEGLVDMSEHELQEAMASTESIIEAQLAEERLGAEYVDPSVFEEKKRKGKEEKADDVTIHTTKELAKVMTEASFKLLRTTERGDAVVVTRNLKDLGKVERNVSERIDELEREAERQVRGFDASSADGGKPSLPVLTLSDVIKTGDDDMPIVIDLPADSVIPVCAPRDHKNHLGYYILVDENGQPCRGQYAFNTGITADVNERLATNAAKSVYGAPAVSTYLNSGMTTAQAIDQMTQIFAVAVNHLLETKLKKEGLTGLDINVHEAVGKSLFFNLLAKNKIKMVFVPATMMVYYRFDHRRDGTGKTFLEDLAFILALRCTFTIAKIMAAVDNATVHRRIEVNVDEKNQNPLETLELVRHSYLNKKAPQFTTDPATAAESIISSHLSIVPKGLVGNTDDLSVTTEKSYGQSQAPDNDLQETLNNWIGMGLKVPPSALNQLSEAEYAKSVATTNLFFSNNVRTWQNIIKPFNRKFIINYILANSQMLNDIRKIIKDNFDGTRTKTVKGVRKAEDPKDESQSQDPQNDEKVEEALKRVISTAEVVLAPPNMATSKAHFEEVQAYTDAVDKILNVIYPDDSAPSDDLKALMSSLRALIASGTLREFLPKLGFHEIANVPEVDEIDDKLALRLIRRLSNIKRRMDNNAKLSAGQLKDQAGGGAGGDMGGGMGEEQTGENGGEENGGESGFDFSGI